MPRPPVVDSAGRYGAVYHVWSAFPRQSYSEAIQAPPRAMW